MSSSLAGYRVYAVCFGVAHFQLQIGNGQNEVTITSSAEVRSGRDLPAVDFRDDKAASWLFDIIDSDIVDVSLSEDGSRVVIEFEHSRYATIWHGEGPRDSLLVMRNAHNGDWWTLG